MTRARTLTQNTQASFRHFVRCRMGGLRRRRRRTYGTPRLRSTSTVKSDGGGGGCTAHLDAITSTRLSTDSSSRAGPVRRRRVSTPAGAVGIPDRGSWDLLPFFSRGPLTCAYLPSGRAIPRARGGIPRESRLSPESSVRGGSLSVLASSFGGQIS